MSLTFFYAPNSTASTVHWTLEELGVPYEAVRVDLTSADDKTKKLAPLNPNRKVPLLVHEGVPIFESAAIQIYLGETFGVERGLYPAPGPKRGQAQAWLVWGNVTLGEAVGRWLRHTSDRVDAGLKNVRAGEEARADVDRLLGLVEEQLRDTYLLGSNPSLVDFHLVSFCQWMAFCGIDFSPFPRTKAWIARCSDRAANQKLMRAS